MVRDQDVKANKPNSRLYVYMFEQTDWHGFEANDRAIRSCTLLRLLSEAELTVELCFETRSGGFETVCSSAGHTVTCRVPCDDNAM